MVINTGSGEVAIAIIDAASTAAPACPEFSDRGGPVWLELLDVLDGGRDAAGLVIASGGQPVLIGYWRSGRTIVKLPRSAAVICGLETPDRAAVCRPITCSARPTCRS